MAKAEIERHGIPVNLLSSPSRFPRFFRETSDSTCKIRLPLVLPAFLFPMTDKISSGLTKPPLKSSSLARLLSLWSFELFAKFLQYRAACWKKPTSRHYSFALQLCTRSERGTTYTYIYIYIHAEAFQLPLYHLTFSFLRIRAS